MATFKSAAVEEFYNRVHSPADGRFATSGTGGGHYKGRAAGKAAPRGSGNRNSTTVARKGASAKAGDNDARQQHNDSVKRRGTAAWIKSSPTGRATAKALKAKGLKTGHENVGPVKRSTDVTQIHNDALKRRNTARWIRDHPEGQKTAAALKAKGLKTGFEKVNPNKKVTNSRDFQRAKGAAPPPPPAKSSGSPFPKPTPNVKPNAMRPVSDFKKAPPSYTDSKPAAPKGSPSAGKGGGIVNLPFKGKPQLTQVPKHGYIKTPGQGGVVNMKAGGMSAATAAKIDASLKRAGYNSDGTPIAKASGRRPGRGRPSGGASTGGSPRGGMSAATAAKIDASLKRAGYNPDGTPIKKK